MAPPPLLTLSGITLGFGGNPLFSDMGLAVQPGDRICLVGRNGSGKSTLMKIMAGLAEPDRGTRFVQPGVRVAYMAQDPDLSAWPTLGAFVAEGLPEGEEYRATIAMEGIKLDPDRPSSQASGGERRRAALARLIAAEPDLMLLDEPTNHLDIEATLWLEEYLADTRAAFLLISHDRAFLRRLTRATLWVDRGEIRRTERGFDGFEDWRDKVFEEEDQQRHKLDRLLKSEGKWAVEGISARRKRNQGRVRRLAEMRDDRRAQIQRTGPARMALDSGPKSGKLVIEAQGISKAFGDRVILRDFDLRVMRGERVALVGPNGIGKTTLIGLLTGTIPPDSGTLRLGSGLVPALFDQNRAELDPDKTLWESLTEDKALSVGGRADQVMVRGTPRHVVGYLKDFLFDERQARGPVRALSGGERARLLLARIMARESNLLILDEPTNDLDVETLDLFQEILDDYDGTVLLVSHDRDFLDRVATTTVALAPGGEATVYAGGWTDYLAQRGAAAVPQAPGPPARGGTRAVPQALAQAPTQPAAPPGPNRRGGRLSFRQAHRLDTLPAEMDRLAAEIAKLEALLADPALFAREPAKFQKATEALAARKAALAVGEEEWLALEALRESLAG